MTIRIGDRRYAVEWGHLLVATLVVVVCVAYLMDARARSLHVNNLLLVQPATILAVILYALIVPQCFHRLADDAEEAPRPSGWHSAQLEELLRVAALATAFGFFTFSLETIGFDVATLIFTAVGLFICGERRSLVLLLFPPAFTVLVVEGYQQLVPYPIVTTVL